MGRINWSRHRLHGRPISAATRSRKRRCKTKFIDGFDRLFSEIRRQREFAEWDREMWGDDRYRQGGVVVKRSRSSAKRQ
jgi:hypothetical protein